MTKFANEQSNGQSRYVDSLSSSKVAFCHLSHRTADKQAAFFLPHLRADMALLDCGYGPGSISVGLARVVAPGRVVGTDIDAAQISRAQSHAASQDTPNLRFETAIIYELPFPDQTFDAVFSQAVFMYPVIRGRGCMKLVAS